MANPKVKYDEIKNELQKDLEEILEIKISKDKTIDVYHAVADLVAYFLENELTVPFGKNGQFEVRERKARNGRNPQTGEPIQIAACKVPAFKPSDKLKDAIKGL